MFEKLSENARKDSGECSRKFWETFWKILGKLSGRFRRMLLKIPGDAIEDSGEF